MFTAENADIFKESIKFISFVFYMNYPQYRKLGNNKVFYKIIDAESFEELKLMGSKVFHFEMKAIQYPEKLKIIDMMNCEGYELANESEWKELRS